MNKEFRVYYNNKPASQEQLDAIEEIVIEQEVGKVWEARIKIPVCIGEDGAWEKEDDAAYKEFARVRIEARIGDGDFIPLIEGRIVSQEPDYNASPGVSSVTMIVHDDSTLLHRKSVSEPFPEKTDKEIIEALFESGSLGGSVEIDELPAAPDEKVVFNQRGTAMQALRAMARRHRDFYAYVLPGDKPGKSDCFFKKLPAAPDDKLAALYLEGPNRNLTKFSIQRNSNQATTYEGQTLSMKDKSEKTGTSTAAAPAGGEPATEGTADDSPHKRLCPGNGDLADPQAAADGAAAKASFTLKAEGSVLPSSYSSILSPYKRVPVRLSNSRYSADYVIFKVIHVLGRSEYTQSFTMRGDAVSPSAPAGLAGPAAAAATGAMGAAFNTQVNIF